MPQVTKSNVLLTPAKDMPMILSQRFQKNGSNSRFLAPRSETTQLEGKSIKNKKILIRNSSSKTSIDQTKSKIIEDKVEKSGQNVSEQTELEYSPFKLQPNSSFNPSKLNPRQVKRLHPLTLAKYEAYSVPNADILNRVMKSECRAKSFLNEERQKYRDKVKESKKKWNIIHCGYEDEDARKIGEKNAQKASERMKSKLHQIFSYRVNSFSFKHE